MDRPIIFSAPMVRAILDGRKTQTRRVAKLPPAPNHLGEWEPTTIGGAGMVDSRGMAVPEHPVIWHTRTGKIIPCPYGQPGDRLWVRETWANPDGDNAVFYRADCLRTHTDEGIRIRWKSGRFMFKWASRLNLEIVSVRPERLQEISLADIQAEGIPDDRATFNAESQLTKFRTLWDSINGKPYPWASNPWVWRIEFKRL